MSKSSETDFDRWLRETFASTGGFTALMMLLEIGETRIAPVSCSYLHVIGDEIDWKQMRKLLDQARGPWQGVVFFAESAAGGGPVIDLVARELMQQRINEVTVNRMRLNDGGMFDKQGRAIRIDPIEVH